MNEPDIQPCIGCGRSVRRIGGNRRRSYNVTQDFVQNHPYVMAYFVEVMGIREFHGEDRLCRACLLCARRHIQENAPVQDEDVAEVQEQPQNVADVQQDLVPQVHIEPEDIVVGNVRDQFVQVNRMQMIALPGYMRAPYNTHVCIFADCFNRDLQRIHVDLRATVLQQKSFYIPRGNRVCSAHLLDLNWQNVEESTRRVMSEFSAAHIKDMMDILRTRKVYLDFDRVSAINDAVFHYYIGFSKSQFTEILESTPSIAQRHKKKAGTALATVLIKLHTGDSNERLTAIFNMTRKTLEKTMRLVRQDLLTEFVPRHLGYDHMTREDVISRCLAIPNALFGNQAEHRAERDAIVIIDGTYIYLQKSSNYYFQRKSYSLHKFRQLVKPFLIVCPDGHILDIYGLYEATKSDSNILLDIIKNVCDPFHWFFRQNDVLILDRGFRDSIEEVEACGYRTYMPATKHEDEPQLTTRQANDSRKVTLCRWVVETVNGRLKNQFRQLRSQTFNRAATHLFDEIRIAGALLNAFGKPLQDHRLVDDIIREIDPRSGDTNPLCDFIITNNLNRRRTNFQSITANVPGMDEFPQISADDLIIFALGTYQIAQARSYYGEHIKQGTYNIEVCKDLNINQLRRRNPGGINPWLLRGRIQSRHTNRRTYLVYVLVEREVQGRRAILGHYCTCIVGKRTLGCCAHGMSCIWYLGWGRFQENLSPPAQFLNLIIRNEVEIEAYEELDD